MLIENKKGEPIPVTEVARFRDGGTIQYQDKDGNNYFTGYPGHPQGIYDAYPKRGKLINAHIKPVESFE